VHVTVTRTKDSLGQPIEIATIAGEEMLRWLQGIEGFEGLLVLSNEADGTTLVISFWESREVAEEHRAARMRLRDRVTATVNVEVQETKDYVVTFAHLPHVSQSPRAG
jgi:heme-degrading monooxygenase HmoA